MERDPRALLWDAGTRADGILTFAAGRTEQDYLADAMLRAAVERHFEIIGEALNRLRKTAPSLAARIPELRRIVDLRNLLIHGYAVVDDAFVWRIVQEDLPRLRKALGDVLADL